MVHKSIFHIREWLPRQKRKSLHHKHLLRKKNRLSNYSINIKYIVFGAGALFLGILTLILQSWLFDNVREYFKIETVRIDAELDNLQAHEIEKNLSLYVNKHFFNVNLEDAKRSLQELSWVREVILKREWPDTVVVTLREQVPVARWNTDFYINDAADVFSSERNKLNADLPELNGPNDKAVDVLLFYTQVAHPLRKYGLEFKALFLDQRGAWTILTQQGIRLKLGTGDVLHRLDTFLLAYNSSFRNRVSDIQTIDLRHSNGFAIRWQEQLEGVMGKVKNALHKRNGEDV